MHCPTNKTKTELKTDSIRKIDSIDITSTEFIKSLMTWFLYGDFNSFDQNDNEPCLFDRDTTDDARYLFNFENYRNMFGNIGMIRECGNIQCMRKDRILLKCNKCKCVFYCNKKCQKMDWKHRHSKECKKRNKNRIYS